MRLTSLGAPAASAIVPLAVYSNMLTMVSERSSPRTMPSAVAAAVKVARASGACAAAREFAANVAAMTTAKVRYDIAYSHAALLAAGLPGIGVAHIEPAAVRKHQRDQEPGRGAVAARIDHEREGAADLEAALAVNAGAAQPDHAERLDRIARHPALLGDIEMHVGVRVDPVDLHQLALFLDRLVDVELRLHGVMRLRGRDHVSQPYNSGGEKVLRSHERPPFNHCVAAHDIPSAATHFRHHVLQVAFFARQILRHERVGPRVEDARDRIHGPGLEQHVRVLNRRDPAQRVALAREALGDLELEAVEVARLVQPALVRKANGLDHQRVALPMADRIALPGLLGDARLVVRPAVGRHDAEGVLPGKAAGIDRKSVV